MKLPKLLMHGIYVWLFTKKVAANGIQCPIILSRNGYVIDGMTRIEAARRLGIEEIPAIVLDADANMVKTSKVFLSHNLSGGGE